MCIEHELARTEMHTNLGRIPPDSRFLLFKIFYSWFESQQT